MLRKNMGPMSPRGLGPWALWAPGALGPNYKKLENSICIYIYIGKISKFGKVAPEDL